MNPSPESFDNLRQLLALKRHEQPPPGYFNRFSDKVIARIEAEGHAIPTSRWQRFLRSLALSPIKAVGYGSAALGLVAAGAGISQYLGDGQAAPFAVAGSWGSIAAAPSVGMDTPVTTLPTVSSFAETPSSVTPVLSASPAHSLFDPNRLTIQRVNYVLP